jgi:hypothetical protein
MMPGAALKIQPNWVPEPVFCDIAWDSQALLAPRPEGPWWGPLSMLDGNGDREGVWVWDQVKSTVELWVPHPEEPHPRRLVAVLREITMPPVPGLGRSGPGELGPFLAPVIGPLPLTWEIP